MTGDEPTVRLINLWDSGDKTAGEALFERYSQRLCELAEREIGNHLANRISAEDITQSAFRTFFRRSRNGQFQIDRKGILWHLLVKIALNKIRKQAARRQSEQRWFSIQIDERKGSSFSSTAPDEMIALKDELVLILTEFSDRDADIFERRLRGCSMNEIAQDVGVSRSTVSRVLDRIQIHLNKRAKCWAE